jgi:MFS family permease
MDHNKTSPDLSGSNATRKISSAFSSLVLPDYRTFFISQLLTFFAMNMQIIARGWLVYKLTDSALLLGLITGIQGICILIFSPIGGVIADRINKKHLIMITVSTAGISAILMSVLIITNTINIWIIMILTLVSSIANAIELPSRTAILTDLVDKERLINAITLNNIGQNVGRIVGPSLAGLLVGFIGTGGVFVIISILYFISFFTILQVSSNQVVMRNKNTHPWIDYKKGFSYSVHHFFILILIIIGVLVAVFGLPYMAMLPIFAEDVLGMGVMGLGILSTSSAIGSLIGSMGLALLGNIKNKTIVLLSATISTGIFIVIFSASKNFYLSCTALALLGCSMSIALVLNQTIIQLEVEPAMQGRVLSIFIMTWGLQTVGAIPIGAIADIIGAPITIGSSGGILALSALLIFIFVPRLRKA